MYAHHAVNHLKEDSRLTALGEDILHLIKISTKFHFGDLIKNVHKLMQPMMLKYEKETGNKFEIFRTYMEKVVSPFEAVWFEWSAPESTDAPKCATLVLKTPSPINKKFDLLNIYSFFFHGTKRKWVFLPIIAKIDMADQIIRVKWTFNDEYVDNTMDQEDRENLEHMKKYMLSCTNLGLLFINCKNVETIKRYPDEKLQKKRNKYGKQPMFTYHVLEIKDMRKKNVYPADHVPTEMGKLRHHQMPARVAYYTAEKPLFGNPKLTGWYAFKSYWRGDPNKGTIIRDYETEKKGGN